MIEVQLDGQGLEIALKRLEGELLEAASTAVQNAVRAGVESAKSTSLFKDRTGALRKNIFGSTSSSGVDVEGKVVADAKYAFWVNNGTARHEISGRRGGKLRFMVNGQLMYRRTVNHPGTAPRPFMDVAQLDGLAVMEFSLEHETNRAIERFNA